MKEFNELFAEIDYRDIRENLINVVGIDYILLTAGSPERFNTMTVGWGGFGFLWQRPVAWVYVRPQRHTFEFMEANEHFTIAWFGATQRNALNICGTLSGRDTDKVKEAGLTPITTPDGHTTFEEALLTFECRKIYYHDIHPDTMLDKSILRNYPQNDFHRVYTGQLLKTWQHRDEK